MESHIAAERIANVIMMDRSFKGHFLIVEGVKDYKLYSKFIQSENVRIKEAFGYEKVILVLRILSERGFTSKIGIIDSDFNLILNVKYEIEGLFITDHHDTEVMMIKSNALDHIFKIYCSTKKIENFEKEKGSIRDIIFELGKQIGNLKLANRIYELGVISKTRSDS